MKLARPKAPVRRSPRLRGFAYDSPGAYFVTTCTFKRQPILGIVSSAGTFESTAAGRIVRETWESLSTRFGEVRIDAFVVMPDHVHGILWLDVDSLKRSVPVRPTAGLSAVMSAFKSISARGVNAALGCSGGPVWQRSFYDRVIRTEQELDAAREYIINNPLAFALKEGGD